MSYEMGHSKYDAGSRVATRTRTPARVNGRSGGTATSSRARRSAAGLNGYGNLAGSYEEDGLAGLGFSLNPLNIIKAVARPVISLIPGGNTVLSVASAFSGLKAGNANEQKRLAQGQADLQAALAGNLAAAKSLYDGRIHSIAFSKAICNQAWAVIVQQRPDIAAQVVREMGVQPGDPPLPSAVATVAPPVRVPMVQQVLNAGLTLATQTTPSGGTQVVATNPATGAVVSAPLPIPPSAVPANAPTLPVNAVQSAAPSAAVDATVKSKSSGIFSILDKLTEQLNANTAASQNAQSQAAVSAAGGGGYAPPAPTTDTSRAFTPTDVTTGGGGSGVSPVLLIGVVAGIGILLMSSHGGRR